MNKNTIEQAAKEFANFFGCDTGEAMDCHHQTLGLMVKYAGRFIVGKNGNEDDPFQPVEGIEQAVFSAKCPYCKEEFIVNKTKN
jgi:hypothetical protein